MTMTNLSAAGHFQSLATNAVTKVGELLRLFNTRATNLVLGAGAIHSAARLKSINAKHLSLVTQCLGMMTALLPHIRAALMAQLPSKQHTLLNDLDKIKKEYMDHSEKVLNKFVTIIGGIVEHGLAPRIANTDFDARAKELSSDTQEIACCVFLDGVSTNTRKMHQVLNAMLPPDHLQDVFSRIFAYVDQKVPTLLISAASGSSAANGKATFRLPTSDDGKHRLIMEVEDMTIKLNGLDGVLPWDFTCTNVLERKLDYKLKKESETTADEPTPSVNDGQEEEDNSPTAVEAYVLSGISETANGDKQEEGNEAESNPENADGD
jgi:vacuolar protein sorting-associated protein 54